jgi:hypothetical protein
MTLKSDTGTRNATGYAQESTGRPRKRAENPHERMTASTAGIRPASGPFGSFYESLNTHRHKVAVQGFMAIVLFHWFEHIVQAYQFFVLRWSRPMSMGFLGMYYPWLMKSEVLHYGFALVMLAGLWMLRKAFTGTSHTWWMIAFWIQFWHHFEHFILFYQAQTQHFWFGGAVPTSVGQIWIRGSSCTSFTTRSYSFRWWSRCTITHIRRRGMRCKPNAPARAANLKPRRQPDGLTSHSGGDRATSPPDRRAPARGTPARR